MLCDNILQKHENTIEVVFDMVMARVYEITETGRKQLCAAGHNKSSFLPKCARVFVFCCQEINE